MADDETRAAQVAAVKTLVDAGYTPQSVADAVARWPLFELFHTGPLSVQLQPPQEPC